ncbi:hypothetical protein GCM10023310_72150 [Paenibacillus vulneris]|uniref:Discoidin domain-containing protein n=1 Tax=Paenibacillus vulneris TaxID=1133364 RepID=A0ABW3UEV5_9BACL
MAIIVTSEKKVDISQATMTSVELNNGIMRLIVTGSSLKDQDITPTMTSNTAPSPYVASASSTLSGYNPYAVFNKKNAINTDSWLTTIPTELNPQWIQLYLGSGRVVTKYTLTSPYWGGSIMIKDWIFQGSLNGTTWVNLDLQVGQTWQANEKRSFSFANTTPYWYYRIVFTSHNGYSDYAGIAEIELMESDVYFSESGQSLFPVIDLGTHFQKINIVSSSMLVPTDTQLKIYISSSNDNITFSEFSLVDSGGNTTSQGRYIKIKIDVLGNSVMVNRMLNDFTPDESGLFQPNKQIIFDGSLKINTNHLETMEKDTTFLEQGTLFRKSLSKDNYKSIVKLYVLD